MDWLRWLLLESTAALGAALFLLNFFLLVHWRRRGRAGPLLVALAASASLLAAQALVVTRRERADRTLAAIERDLLLGRLGAVEAALGEGSRCDGMDRADFLDFARRQLDRIRVDALWRTHLSTAPAPDGSFIARAVYLSDVRTDDYVGRTKSSWDVTFVRTGAGWRIGGLRLVELNGRPVDGMRGTRP